MLVVDSDNPHKLYQMSVEMCTQASLGYISLANELKLLDELDFVYPFTILPSSGE